MKVHRTPKPTPEPVPLTRAVPTRGALIDLVVVAVFVWVAVFVIHRFDVPEALAHWGALNQQWAIDEVTMVSLCVTAGMGVFAWRRWQESLATIARHEATLQRLHTTESEIESKDRLIRSVSHELRTPLTALLGFAELLGGPSIDAAERRSAVKTIVSQGRDLSNIVDDLLTRAQVEASTLRLARVSLSLGAQAAQVVEAWGSDGADQILTSSDRDVRGWGDPARVRQIIRNLISNALKYGDGTVEISTSSSGDTAYIAVVNPGAPIPLEHRDRIFEPYHRAATDDRNPGGLGLGLAISLQLARLMGGDITYTAGKRTSIFELSLPRFLDGVPTADPEAAPPIS